MCSCVLSGARQQVGAERFNLFTGCPKAKTATMVLRGGSEQFIDEAERSLHDAIMIVRRALKNAAVVAGGGAIDMEVSRCAWPPHTLATTASDPVIIAQQASAQESTASQGTTVLRQGP